jgi:hypothetical protein
MVGLNFWLRDVANMWGNWNENACFKLEDRALTASVQSFLSYPSPAVVLACSFMYNGTLHVLYALLYNRLRTATLASTGSNSASRTPSATSSPSSFSSSMAQPTVPARGLLISSSIFICLTNPMTWFS